MSHVRRAQEDLAMWWNADAGIKDSRTPDGHDRDARNQRILVSTALVVTMALFLASSAPPQIAAASLRGMLFYAALAAMVMAAVRRESFAADYLTGWDQTLMLVLSSIAAGFLVDPHAVRQFMETTRAAAAG
jgi:hypothetical protein